MKQSLAFTAILGLLITSLITRMNQTFGQKDLVAYWSSSRLLLQGQNPYAADQLRDLQDVDNPDQDAGLSSVWNPPWLLVVLFPLAALPFEWAAFLWMWGSFLLLGLCTCLCLKLGGLAGDGRPFLLAYSAGLLFFPTLFLLGFGQVSLLVTVGLVGSSYALKRGNDPLAGALLVLATIKPHLSYLALAWIGWWVIRNRRWSVILWSGLTAVLFSLAALLLYPDYFRAYASLLVNLPVSSWHTSTVWSFIEASSGQPVFHWWGILLLPLVFILQPAPDQSDWLPKLGLVLAASVAFAPFGFIFDQVVLQPVMVQVLAWGVQGRLGRGMRWAAVAALAAVDLGIAYLLLSGRLAHSWYFWVPFALLLFYGLAMWVVHRRKPGLAAMTSVAG